MNNTFSAHDVRRISVEACRDPRSVSRFLRGETVRPTVAASIEAALAKLGIARPSPQVATHGPTEGTL